MIVAPVEAIVIFNDVEELLITIGILSILVIYSFMLIEDGEKFSSKEDSFGFKLFYIIQSLLFVFGFVFEFYKTRNFDMAFENAIKMFFFLVIGLAPFMSIIATGIILYYIFKIIDKSLSFILSRFK